MTFIQINLHWVLINQYLVVHSLREGEGEEGKIILSYISMVFANRQIELLAILLFIFN